MSNPPEKATETDVRPSEAEAEVQFKERPYTGTGYVIGAGKAPDPKPRREPPPKSYPLVSDLDEACVRAMEKATDKILAERRKGEKPD